MRTYTVKPGDTLDTIAGHFYGDRRKIRPIWEHNRAIIENPNQLFPGQVLVIPYDTHGLL